MRAGLAKAERRRSVACYGRAAGLLVVLGHAGVGLAHRLDGGVERDDMLPVAQQRR